MHACRRPIRPENNMTYNRNIPQILRRRYAFQHSLYGKAIRCAHSSQEVGASQTRTPWTATTIFSLLLTKSLWVALPVIERWRRKGTRQDSRCSVFCWQSVSVAAWDLLPVRERLLCLSVSEDLSECMCALAFCIQNTTLESPMITLQAGKMHG